MIPDVAGFCGVGQAGDSDSRDADQKLLQFVERFRDRDADGADSKRNSTLLASNWAISAASPISRFRRSLSSLMMVSSSCLSSGE